MNLYPDQGHKVMEWQRIRIPRHGSTILLINAPGGSYASAGERYVVSLVTYRNQVTDIHLTDVVHGSGTYDRPLSWKYAKWEYVK